MKRFLFNTVSFLGANSIRVIQFISRLVLGAVELVGISAIKFIAALSYHLMMWLDPEHMKLVAEMSNGQDNVGKQQTELKLLGAASHVKEHAETTGNWTDSHSDALEAIGNALLNECE